jgi:hypothetical protein
MVRVEWVETYGRTKSWNVTLKSNRRKHRVREKISMRNKEDNSNLVGMQASCALDCGVFLVPLVSALFPYPRIPLASSPHSLARYTVFIFVQHGEGLAEVCMDHRKLHLPQKPE